MNINLILHRALFLSLAMLLLSACGTKKPVTIVHKKSIYGKSASLNSDKYSVFKDKEKNKNINKVRVNLDEEKNSTRQVQIKDGDTLYSISKAYQAPLRDLIETNNLLAPYNLQAGSYLTIPQPIYYKIKAGDTIYSISRQHQMKIDDLVTLNKMTPPYILVAEQMIKVKGDIKNDEVKDNSAIADKKADEPNENVDKNQVATAKIANKNNHFSWPIEGQIISAFGPKKGGLYNDGINIEAKEGSVVKAAEDGLAAYVGNELKGYGNLVIIKHSGGWITAYAHLLRASIKRGDKINKGQDIGFAGSSGNVKSPQLYFGLRKGRDAFNPENYL